MQRGGGWGGGCERHRVAPPPGSQSLADLPHRGGGEDTGRAAVRRGITWLVEAVESGRFRDPSPIGFYFAKLWYFEKLYPLIFTVAALGRAARLS